MDRTEPNPVLPIPTLYLSVTVSMAQKTPSLNCHATPMLWSLKLTSYKTVYLQSEEILLNTQQCIGRIRFMLSKKLTWRDFFPSSLYHLFLQ